MKIVDVRVTLLSIPTNLARYPDVSGRFGRHSFCLVELETDDGLVGLGDAFCWGCEHAVAGMIVHHLAPRIKGQDASQVAALTESLFRSLAGTGRAGVGAYAVSGIELALWDLAGKRAGLPLCDLLGGASRREVPVYASLVRHPEAHERIGEECAKALAEGYTMIKLHQTTAESVRLAQGVVCRAVPITVDVNWEWTTHEALRHAEAMREHDILWLEEPVWPPEDFEALREVQSRSGVALASGENLSTARQFKRMMDVGAVSFVQPSVTKVGGVAEFLDVARLARHYNLELAAHSPYLGPGLMATLHLIAHTGQSRWLERFYLELEAPLFEGEGNLTGPVARVPTGPGLGVSLNADTVREYRQRF
ncbi:MAG: mandelate racemase/muconate lactonizing enzyme family protein [Chromatiales bacterium]|jgi:D-galactarolactone cycloisomerase|nr:mandelate racemase/muconate lactonizing enzyme family protein [Chromatiales bacterium]